MLTNKDKFFLDVIVGHVVATGFDYGVSDQDYLIEAIGLAGFSDDDDEYFVNEVEFIDEGVAKAIHAILLRRFFESQDEIAIIAVLREMLCEIELNPKSKIIDAAISHWLTKMENV